MSNSFFYKNLIQYSLKKGQKYKTEVIYRKTLFKFIQNENKQNKLEKFNTISSAVKNTTPCVNVKMKRRGARYIAIPIKITPERAKYLSSNWLIKHSLNKKSKKFSDNFLEEILESSKKLSNSYKKCNELNNLGFESLTNINIYAK